MSTTLQFRRYDTANVANTTGANGEIIIDSDKDTVVVQDGATVGGFPLARESTLNAAYAQANTARNQANSGSTQADTARDQANNAYAQANAAYADANTRVLKAGDTMTGNLNVAATLITQNIIPNLNVTYDIGTANNRFRDLYLSGGTIYLGDSVLEAAQDEMRANTFNAAISFVNGGLNVLDQANSARSQANTARGTANDAYAQANSAYAEANLKLNIAGGTITGSLIVSGNLEVLGNSTTLNVETLNVEDNEIILNSNVTGAPALDAFITVNRGSSINASLKWDENTNQWKWNDGDAFSYAFDSALDAYQQANDAYGQANTARDNANNAYATANGALAQADDARAQANTARDQANTARGQANTAYGQANDAYAQANTARNTANDALTQANSARDQANNSYAQANSAYAEANLKLNIAGGTITGNLVVSGNLEVLGNSTTLNVETLSVEDNEIILNSSVSAPPTLNAYITINRGTLTNAELIWDETNDQWKWSDGEAASYPFDLMLDAYAQANTARDTANGAYGQANAAYADANTRVLKAGDTMTGTLNVNSHISANVFRSTNTTLSAPSLSTFDGERLRLYDFQQEGHPNYAIGVEGSHIWMGVDDTGPTLGFKWYGNTTLVGLLRTNSTFEVSNTVAAKTIRANGTGTAIDASQGNILTNQVTGTQFNFLSGLYTASITGGGTVNSNYTLKLPPNTGLAGQMLTTDGTGNLNWSSSTLDTANSAYSQANDAYAQANSARNQANTARGTANDSYAQANTARGTANDAYAQANAAYGDANTRVLKAGDTMTGNLNVAATLITQNIVPNLNVTYSLGAPDKRFKDLYLSGNTIYLGDTVLSATEDEMRANTFNAAIAFVSGGLNVLDQANSARSQANTARDTANGAYAQANGAYGQANGAYAQANTGIETANGAYAQANGAYAQANGAYGQANGAYAQANIAYGQANDAYSQANSARLQANNAYAEANLKLNLTGGTISGSLNVAGNLSITGNTTYYNVTTYSVDDPLIYLAANNETSDLVDIGFIGGHNTGGVYQHSGLARHAGDGNWYLFTGLSDEGHENNVIDVANTKYAMLRANIEAQSINVGNVPVANTNHANNAYNKANDAYGQANTARGVANDAYGQANTARDQANTARDQANTARGVANDSYGQANTARDQANTARDTANGAYGQANGAYAQANGAYGQANNAYAHANIVYAQANAAYGQANAAYGAANNRVLKAGDTMTGNLIMSGATINTSIANISTIVTGNTLTLSTASGSNGNVVISANGKDIIRANDNCVAIGLSLADTSGVPLTVRLNSSTLGAVASFQQKNIAGVPLGEMIFKTGSGFALIDHYDVNIADQTTRSFGFSPSRFYVSMEGNTQLAVVPSGKLGVFTDDPTSNLHVIGNANITLGIVTGAGVNAATVNATTVNASTLLTNSGINVSAQAADAYGQANSARNQANSGYGQANSARDQANTAYAQANSARNQANTAYGQANDAYAAANTKLPSAGGTISGDLIISGNLVVSGNSTTLNTETLIVEDAEIVLLSNVAGTPALNAGLIVNRGTSTNTFLRWNEASDKWGWSDDGIIFYSFDTSLIAYSQANSARDQANTARATANDAYGAANTRVLKAGDTMTGNLIMSGATVNTVVANITTIITGNTLTLSTGAASNGNVVISANGVEYVRTTNTGNVGIGQTNPAYKLDVTGSIRATGDMFATNFDSTSDIAVKENIREIESPLETLKQLHGVVFTWKETKNDSLGVIAQELEKVLPQLTSTNAEGRKSVTYNGIIALLIEAVKELAKKVEEK